MRVLDASNYYPGKKKKIKLPAASEQTFLPSLPTGAMLQREKSDTPVI